jgi:hypothetical protein
MKTRTERRATDVNRVSQAQNRKHWNNCYWNFPKHREVKVNKPRDYLNISWKKDTTN